MPFIKNTETTETHKKISMAEEYRRRWLNDKSSFYFDQAFKIYAHTTSDSVRIEVLKFLHELDSDPNFN